MPTRDSAWPQGTPCWVDAQVDDLTAARSFYSELFGWEVQDSPEEAGGYLMAMLNGKPAAGLGPKPEGMPMPSVWTTYLAADSADDIHAKVVAAGGQPFMEPFDVMDVGRMFVAADPTGAVFGVWEAKAHTGAGIANEPGAYTWNEVHTPGYEAAKKFYADAFGYTYTEIGDGETFNYATFAVPGQGDGAASGGVHDTSKEPGDTPAHWLTWFHVDDTDKTVETALGLGATVMMPIGDSPNGRMAVLAGPQGEAFGVIDPSKKAGG